MEKLIFSVYDVKAEVFGTPIFFNTRGEAVRAFQDEAHREGSMIAAHPEDYSLFLIGTYDPASGVLHPQTIMSLGTALDYRAGSTDQLQLVAQED